MRWSIERCMEVDRHHEEATYFLENAMANPKLATLPFNLTTLGGWAEVTQGVGGTTSHGGALNFSLDFALPAGTRLYAPADMVVLDLVESVKDGARASTGPNDPS